MSSNNLILKNSIFLFLRTIVITIVGFLTIRELLNLLGIEEYGLFNLVFGVATLFSFLNGAMISSSQRYFSLYLVENKSKFKDVWKCSLTLHLIIAFFVSILLLFLKNYILDDLLNIDGKFNVEAEYIYICSIFYIFILIIQAPFSALILAHEKMSFFAWLSLVDALIKLFIIFILYFFKSDLLILYTVFFVISSSIVFVFYLIFSIKKLNAELRIFNLNTILLKEMFIYCLWNIFGNFSFLFKLQGINVILNIFYGLAVNSAYTITNTITSVINNLVNSIVTAFNPQIYKSFAIDDFERSQLLIDLSSKISFFIAYILIIPTLFNLNFLLDIWLESKPLFLYDFLKLSLIILLIDCLSGSLMTGIQATGKVKLYQISVSFIIIMNLPVSYFLLKIGFDPYYIYIIGMISSILCFILRLFFLRMVSKHNTMKYIKDVIWNILKVSLVSMVLIQISLKFIDHSSVWLSFLISVISFEFFIVLSIIFFGLSPNERKFFYSKFFGYLK